MKKHITITVMLITAALTVHFACSSPGAEQQIFKKRCGMCHKLPAPQSFTKKAWDEQVDRMAKRAGLSPEQIVLIKGLRK